MAWARYNQQKKDQAWDPTAALSRIEFREVQTPTPLHTALEEASKPSGLESESGAESFARIRLLGRDEPDGKRKMAYCRCMLVVAACWIMPSTSAMLF